MQTPSTQRVNAPDAFESQSDRTCDDVHDSVPLSALANIARAPVDNILRSILVHVIPVINGKICNF